MIKIHLIILVYDILDPHELEPGYCVARGKEKYIYMLYIYKFRQKKKKTSHNGRFIYFILRHLFRCYVACVYVP